MAGLTLEMSLYLYLSLSLSLSLIKNSQSVMHYGGADFGNGRTTIQTLDPTKQNVIGQRNGVDVI